MIRRSQGGVYIGHSCLCICLSVPRRISTLLHGPGCKLGEWKGVPSSSADWQSVHRFHCYDSITLNAKCPRVLVPLLYAWFILVINQVICSCGWLYLPSLQRLQHLFCSLWWISEAVIALDSFQSIDTWLGWWQEGHPASCS